MSVNRIYLHRLQIRTITARHKSNEPTEENQLRSFINRPASFFYNTIISYVLSLQFIGHGLSIGHKCIVFTSFQAPACMEEFNINSNSPPPRPKYTGRGGGSGVDIHIDRERVRE